MHFTQFIVFLTLLFSLFASQIQWQQLFGRYQTYPPSQEQYWFTQIVDHFNYQNSQTWNQRYFVFKDFFNPATGPIILYICGQSQCRGISNTSFTARIAQQTKGLVLSLEHRYYGKSLPFGNDSLSLANLKYLTAEQALKDLAYFITRITDGGQHGVLAKSPWITIGGSYPGALAAWFRNKYPHLTIGSISSSGVILAIQNFRMFDEQIYISAIKSGGYCVSAINDVTNYVEAQVTGDQKQQFKAKFNASQLTARQFLFYFSDVIVFQIQYGNRVNFCNSLKDKNLQQQFQIISNLVNQITPVDYGAFYLSNETFAIQDGRGGRSWYYQSCTQFSYFQTYAQLHPMRSRMLTLDFYRKWCEDIFGDGRWPYVSRVNNQLGGLDLNTNHLIMTNGDQDPWQWASLQKSTKPSIFTHIITCDNCAHCVDLRAPNNNDAHDLNTTRAHQLQTINTWINQHWAHVQRQ